MTNQAPAQTLSTRLLLAVFFRSSAGETLRASDLATELHATSLEVRRAIDSLVSRGLLQATSHRLTLGGLAAAAAIARSAPRSSYGTGAAPLAIAS